MNTYISRRPTILDELLRRDGLRGHSSIPQCAGCHEERGTYRCIDCTIQRLYCASCITHQHESTPLHRIEVCSHILKTTLSYTRLGLERRVLQEDIPQRRGVLFLSWPPTHTLPVVRLRKPNRSRDRQQRSSPHQSAILHVHRERSVGRGLPPTLARRLVRGVFPATEDGIHLRRSRFLPQARAAGKAQSLRLLLVYLAEK